jgi:hypothetical protein
LDIVLHHLKFKLGIAKVAASGPDHDIQLDIELLAGQRNGPGAGGGSAFN